MTPDQPAKNEAVLVLDLLRGRYPRAKVQTLKRMVSAGRVRVAGKPVTRLRQAVDAGAMLDVDERPARATEPQRGIMPSLEPLSLVHEDEDVLVVVKPPGLLTSTVPRERRATALAIVRH
jgi:23S rRNA-/tRNA-specific pseudouridylate synthase